MIAPEKAWESALSVLESEMPEEAFSRWVKDVRLGLFENDTFILNAKTEYGRDWLESRLSSTVTRILTGIVNRTVSVRFIVVEEPEADDDGGNLQPESAGENHLVVQVVEQSLRDEIVHPSRVVSVPGYIRRWLPILGPETAWIYVSFRQLCYLCTRTAPRANVEFRVSDIAGARWAGTSRSSFWRHKDDWTLKWFLERSRDDEHKYCFRATMPLTPIDADALRTWLIEAGVKVHPVETLDFLLQLDLKEILVEPPPLPAQDHLDRTPKPQSVQDVVLEACGRVDKTTLKVVMERADILAAKIMPPQDLIIVTHYFLLHWVKELGAGPAWTVTLLRDKCFDSESESRNRVWVKGGTAEIAQMLGFTRARTIEEWLLPVLATKPTKPEAKQKDPQRAKGQRGKRDLVGLFLKRSGCKPMDPAFLKRVEDQDRGYAWQFEVSLHEPLISIHQKSYDGLLDALGHYLETGDRDELYAQVESAVETNESAFETSFQDENPRLKQGNPYLKQPESAIEAEGIRARDTLNSINSMVDLIYHMRDHNTTNCIERGDGADPKGDQFVVVGPQWDWQELFKHNPEIRSTARKELGEKQVPPGAFVSWLLYAASPAGKGIKTPVFFAISHLCDEPSGAGNMYDRLAALAPRELYNLIRLAIGGQSTRSPEWQTAMAGSQVFNLIGLRKQLFGFEG